MNALKRRAIVYLAAPTILGGVLGPEPDTVRIQRVLSASNAPGVELIVAVFPRGGAFSDEMRAIRKCGKAYVLVELPELRVRPRVLGASLARASAIWLWLPHDRAQAARGSAR